MSTFEKTISISAHAENNGLTSMELIENPKTGKLFGKDSKGNTYRVSEKIAELDGTEAVSWFTPDDGDASYMIHPAGQSNVVSVLSFTKTPAKSAPAPATAPASRVRKPLGL
jgi:hypothetical protein